MKADDRLKNIIKIGYLEHNKEQNKVEAELPPINVDVTRYDNHPSWGQSNTFTAGFWESYFHGVKLALGFIGKVIIFLVFAWMGLKIYNWIV
jgi:tetrahydromethanopterin S-methyltransferase subunit B